jgi:hypothetical protein
MYIFRNSPEPSCKEEDMSVSSLIDVHHHVIPPEVRARLANHGVTEVGGVPVPRWDEARELEVLDRHRITTTVVSLSDTGQAAAEAKLVRLISRIRFTGRPRLMMRSLRSIAGSKGKTCPGLCAIGSPRWRSGSTAL